MRVARMGAVIAAYGSTTREPKISFFPLLARNLVIRMVHMYGLPQSAKDEAIRDISEWSGTAGAQFAVAARFPLDQIVAAHQMVEAGAKVGHVLLEV
jgi:NADPH2:quinone reductase